MSDQPASARRTLEGNVASDPVPGTAVDRNGVEGPVARFRFAEPKYKREDGKRVEDGTNFYSVTAWGNLGQQALKNVRKGQRVVIIGGVTQEGTYTNREGVEAPRLSVAAHDISMSIAFHDVTVARKAERVAEPTAEHTADVDAGMGIE